MGQMLARPFPSDERIPISPIRANDVSQTILGRIANRRPEVRPFVDADVRDRLNRIWDKVRGDSLRYEAAIRPILNQLGVGLELVGEMRPSAKGGLEARYRIVDLRTAGMIAQSDWVEIAPRLGLSYASVTWDDGLRAAAKKAIEKLPALAVVHDDGITDGERGGQGILGRWIGMTFQNHLVEQGRNSLASHSVRLAADIAPPPDRGAKSAFLLTGTYNIYPSHLEVTLRLTGAEAWAERLYIERSSMPEGGRNLEDKRGRSLLEDHFPGPFGLTMLSPKGHAPYYKIGEKLSFSLGLAKTAEVYCFAADRTGIARLFPNARHPNAALPGGRSFRLPEDAEPGSCWAITEPPEISIIKCFALSPESARRLPPALTDLGQEIVPSLDEQGLLGAFRQATGGQLSEASLVATVVQERLSKPECVIEK